MPQSNDVSAWVAAVSAATGVQPPASVVFALQWADKQARIEEESAAAYKRRHGDFQDGG